MSNKRLGIFTLIGIAIFALALWGADRKEKEKIIQFRIDQHVLQPISYSESCPQPKIDAKFITPNTDDAKSGEKSPNLDSEPPFWCGVDEVDPENLDSELSDGAPDEESYAI